MRAKCRVLKVHAIGFTRGSRTVYRDKLSVGAALQVLSSNFGWKAGCVYGYRKIYHDLLSLGETCAANTVVKFMPDEG